MGKVKKAAYCVFSQGAISGTGVFTRTEAIARAFTARHTEGIEFRIFGTGDRAAIPDWLPTVKNEATLIAPGKDANQQLVQALKEYGPDLILVDSYPANILPYLKGKERETFSVWGIMRHTPGGFGTGQVNQSVYGVFDRLYQIEPSNHGLAVWHDTITTERTQSVAEKERGIRDKYFHEPHPDPNDMSQFKNWPTWYERHKRESRKFIAPTVNVDANRVMSRLEARRALLAHAELDLADAETDKPIALIALTAGQWGGEDYKKSAEWQAAKLKEWGVAAIPQDERLLVMAGMFAYPKLPELWRYLPGVDYLLSGAGYNSFYETRYLKALGLFRGKAAFWPMAGYIDQPWRAANQEGLFSGKLYPLGLDPIENGADYIAIAIEKKLGPRDVL